MRMIRRGGSPMMMGGRPGGGHLHHHGGGSGSHMGGGIGFMKTQRMPILRMPFDLIISESFYTREKPAQDDKELTQAIIKRHAELVPPPQEQTSIQSLILLVQGVLEGLTVAPTSFEACVSLFIYMYFNQLTY